ncbi:MAG: CDP-diacylglycerol--serine O-phosphatidyltransferase [Bacteroidota bacterium]|nr:CDP-diacylglycerol--serine O-phosphatidyltransferase [Bacteroidota bacterium]
MNIIIRNIPNTITMLNLVCGLISIYCSFEKDLQSASYFIFYGAIFDFFDGLFARFLKINSELGKQLDSLSDLVSFGVAPGFIMFHLINQKLNFISCEYSMISCVAIIIPVLSACRLANFNLDKKQINEFIGLPTPATAIFFASIPLVDKLSFTIFDNVFFLIFVTLIIPFFLITKIPLFSLKFRRKEKINNKLNTLRILLFVISIILFYIFKFAALPIIVFLYVILSLINNAK